MHMNTHMHSHTCTHTNVINRREGSEFETELGVMESAGEGRR